jgi:hypothetical protein
VRYPTVSDYVKGNQTICGSLFRRKWWVKVGGYDESMREGYEDWDFWTRVRHAGAGVTVLDEVLFHYRWYPDAVRANVRGSMASAKKNEDAILPYMRAKWTRLGINQPRVVVMPKLDYPVKLAISVKYKGKDYPAGTRIGRDLALGMKAAGLLKDSRIV